MELSEKELEKLRAEIISLEREVPRFFAAAAEKEEREGNNVRAEQILRDGIASLAEGASHAAVKLAEYHLSRYPDDPEWHLAESLRFGRIALNFRPNLMSAQAIVNEAAALRVAANSPVAMPKEEDHEVDFLYAGAGHGAETVVMQLGRSAEKLVESNHYIAAERIAWRACTIAARELPRENKWTLFAKFYHGRALEQLGRKEEALGRYNEASEYGATGDSEREQNRHVAWRYKAQVLNNMGRYSDALVEVDKLLISQSPYFSEGEWQVIATRILRANALTSLDRKEEALHEIDTAHRLGTRHLGQDIFATDWFHFKCEILFNLGRYQEAADLNQLGLARYGELGEATSSNGLLFRAHFAEILYRLGRYGDALTHIDEIVPLQSQLQGVSHPHTLATRRLKARLLLEIGKGAQSFAEIETVRSLEPAEADERSETNVYWAEIVAKQGRADDALREIEGVVRQGERISGFFYNTQLIPRVSKGAILLSLERPDEALRELSHALDLQREFRDPLHPEVIRTQLLQCTAWARCGGRRQALELIESIIPAATNNLGSTHPVTLGFVVLEEETRRELHGDRLIHG